jgi:hypothetical protein
MIAVHLDAIERLRAHRERSALLAVLDMNRAKEKVEAMLKRANDILKLQADAQGAIERQLYEQTLAAPLTLHDLEGIQARIQQESATIATLAEQCGKLRKTAEEAALTAENARIRHSSLLRAKKKWEEVRTRYAYMAETAEVRQEELLFEDALFRNQSS